MYRPFVVSALAAAVAAGLASAPLWAAGKPAAGTYEYRPYSSQNQAGSDAAASPANDRAASPVAPPGDEMPDDAAPSATSRAYQPAYRNDAARAPQIYDGRDTGGPSRPSAADQGSPRGYGETRRIKATASAPDRSVPYDLREQDARRAAIGAWRRKASERFGPEFSRWRMAQGRHVDCVRERSDDAVCTVSGVPVLSPDRDGTPDQDDRD